jgi:putative nucleotidyltransferase with HDIG domain
MNSIVKTISAMVKTVDLFTAAHQSRVANLACIIGKEIDLAIEDINMLRIAGLLHDIGKLSVPAEILYKPSTLNELEFSMIKAHPWVAYEILKTTDLPLIVTQAILQHHERLDGSGYPQGLVGKDIILYSKILAVSDVVEAMSTHRPYRPAFALGDVLREITKGKGTLYDSKVVDACIGIFSSSKAQINHPVAIAFV